MPMFDYATGSYSGRVVVPADNSTSIEVDWRGLPAPAVPASLLEEFAYKKTVCADGYEKGKELSLRLYLRRPAVSPAPAVLVFPGGGFFSCSPEILRLEQDYLASKGYAVVTASYRLLGEGLVDDMLEDIADAVGFVRSNSSELGIIPDRLAVLGNSASGYLVSLAGTKLDLGLKAVVSLYGPTDLLRIADDHDEGTRKAWHDCHSVLNQIVNGVFSDCSLYDFPEKAEAVNPLSFVDGSEPAFLFMHGSEDPEVSPSQTVLLHNALIAKGVLSVRYSLKGSGHGGPDFDCLEALEALSGFLERTV